MFYSSAFIHSSAFIYSFIIA